MKGYRQMLGSGTLRIDAACAAIGCVMTIACAGAVVWPMIATARDAPQQTGLVELESRVRSEEATLRVERSALGALQEQLNDAVTLEPASGVNTRLVGLAALADRCGVSITMLTHQKAQPQKHAVVVPIKIGGSGSYVGVTRFVRALHDQYRDTAVVGLSILGAPSETPKDAAYTLDLAWYAAPEGSAGRPAQGNRSEP